MVNEKLKKSLKTTYGIVKFLKVMMVVAFVFCVIATLAIPSMGEFLIFAVNSGEAPELSGIFAGVSPEDITAVGLATMIPALIALVIAFLYLKKAQELLRKMNEEAVFAAGYGDEIRSIAKLIIIECVGGYVLTLVALMIFAPQMGTSSVTFDIGSLFLVAFVYLASYLMDHAYEVSKKDEIPEEAQAVYIEPMIGDGREE